MAFWTSDDHFDPSLSLSSDQAANTGWGFDALDGGGQDWWVVQPCISVDSD